MAMHIVCIHYTTPSSISVHTDQAVHEHVTTAKLLTQLYAMWCFHVQYQDSSVTLWVSIRFWCCLLQGCMSILLLTDSKTVCDALVLLYQVKLSVDSLCEFVTS